MSDLKQRDLTLCKVIQYKQALVDHSDRPLFSRLLFSLAGTLRLYVCVCVFFFCSDFWKFIYFSVRNSDYTESKNWMIVNNVLVGMRKKRSWPIYSNYLDICLKRVFSQPIFRRHLLNKSKGRFCVRSIARCLF